MDGPLQATTDSVSFSQRMTGAAPEKPTSKNGTTNTTNLAKKEKKSGSGQLANADGNTAGEGVKEKTKESKEKKHKDEMTIDDLLLPRTLISRLSRGTLPPNTSLQKDALLALTKSATVFISYLAHTANSLTSRKTIQADDILKAISEMELDSVMRDRLEKEIQLFEEGVRGKRKGYRDRVKARESGVSQIEGTEVEDDGTGEHVHKRMKRNIGDEDVDMAGVSDSTRQAGTKISTDANDDVDGEDDDDEDDDPSAQLLAEASRAAGPDDADDTESGHDENEDEDAEDDEEEEEEDDEDEDDNDRNDRNEIDGRDEVDELRKRQQYLAPDGRAEIDGSDNESD